MTIFSTKRGAKGRFLTRESGLSRLVSDDDCLHRLLRRVEQKLPEIKCTEPQARHASFGVSLGVSEACLVKPPSSFSRSFSNSILKTSKENGKKKRNE
jgi:hypothetical protein